MEVGKVLKVVDYIAFVDLVEHCVAQDGHDEEDEHQEDEDVEQRVD